MQRSKKRARMKLQFNHLGRDDTACSGATPIDGGTMFQPAIAVNGEFSGSPKQWNRIPSPSKFVSEQITIFYEEEVSIDSKTGEWRIFQLVVVIHGQAVSLSLSSQMSLGIVIDCGA